MKQQHTFFLWAFKEWETIYRQRFDLETHWDKCHCWIIRSFILFVKLRFSCLPGSRFHHRAGASETEWGEAFSFLTGFWVFPLGVQFPSPGPCISPLAVVTDSPYAHPQGLGTIDYWHLLDSSILFFLIPSGLFSSLVLFSHLYFLSWFWAHSLLNFSFHLSFNVFL